MWAGASPLVEEAEEVNVGRNGDITDHLTDLTNPASWYPAARMMRRKVYLLLNLLIPSSSLSNSA